MEWFGLEGDVHSVDDFLGPGAISDHLNWLVENMMSTGALEATNLSPSGMSARQRDATRFGRVVLERQRDRTPLETP